MILPNTVVLQFKCHAVFKKNDASKLVADSCHGSLWLQCVFSAHCEGLTWLFLGVFSRILSSPLVPEVELRLSMAWSRSSWVFRGNSSWEQKKTESTWPLIHYCSLRTVCKCCGSVTFIFLKGFKHELYLEVWKWTFAAYLLLLRMIYPVR